MEVNKKGDERLYDILFVSRERGGSGGLSNTN